jgi:hypothetical protein
MTPEQIARAHALGFLLPVEPRVSILTIGKSLLEMARKDPNVAKKFNTIKQKMGDGKPLISKEQSIAFESMKSRQVVPNIPTAPEWVRPLLGVGYLRAKDAVASGKASRVLTNPEESLDKVIRMIDNLEQPFLGELLLETVRLAKQDREFAKKLSNGAAEFRALVDDLYGIKDFPDKSEASARLIQTEGCSVCRTDPSGAKVCSPISCWIVVIVIIVIVVSK